MRSIKRYSLILFSILLVSSCVSRQDIAYFQEIENLSSQDNLESITFKPNDMLSIVVSAASLEAVAPFNLIGASRISQSPSMGSSSSMSGGGTQVPYMVNTEGEIEFPVLGTINVLGMTTKELQDYLKDRISEYVKDPIVNVRVMNFTVSIIGAVNSPGTYPVSGERISIVEALAIAGDLAIFGRRDNILIVRELDGKKTYKYLDIRDPEILNSDYYYLKQHDIVYVEHNRSSMQNAIANRNISVYIGVASFLFTLFVFFDK